ncbi:MAG: hypothetical protein N3A38_10510 [Planctomycetota bacterium]|nr:hypothetical protein [Planctomycetota bacterium]
MRGRHVRALVGGVLGSLAAFSYALATAEGQGSGSRAATIPGHGLGTLGTVMPLDFLTANDLGYVIVGTRFTRKFDAFGGVKPYSFHYHNSNFPPFAVLSAAGYMVGTAGAGSAGNYIFSITVRDTAGTVPNVHTKDFSIWVLDDAPIHPCIAYVDLYGLANQVNLPRYPLVGPMQFPPYTIPPRAIDADSNGVYTVAEGGIPLGQPYFGKLDGVGGEPLYDYQNGFYYNWSIESGNLPSGLNLSENGTVFGVAYKANETATFLPAMSDRKGTINGNPVPAPGMTLVTADSGAIGNSLVATGSEAYFEYGRNNRDWLSFRAYANGNVASRKGDLIGATMIFLWGGASFGPFLVDDKGIVREDTPNGTFLAAVTPYTGRVRISVKRANLSALVRDPSGKPFDGSQTNADDPDVATHLMISRTPLPAEETLTNYVNMGGTTVLNYDYLTRSPGKGRLKFRLARTGKTQGGVFQILWARATDGIEEVSGRVGNRFIIEFVALGLGDTRFSIAPGSDVYLALMNATYTLPSSMFTTTSGGVKLTAPTLSIRSLRIGNNGKGRLVTDFIASETTGLPQAHDQPHFTRMKIGFGIQATLADGTPFAGEAGTELFATGRIYRMKREKN